MEEHVFKKYVPEEVFNKITLIDTIKDLLDKAINEYSDKVAIKKNDSDITYRELYNDVNSVCNVLKQNEIVKKTNVGVISFNNYNFVKASIGAMAYGCVATLLPFQLDEKSIYGCCLKYDLTCLFYDPALEEKINFAKNLLANVKFIKIESFSYSNELLIDSNIKKEDRACIVLTGGTTGKSKGAILSHQALMMGTVNGMYADPHAFEHVYYSIMPLTHVFGLVRNLLTCLYSGSMIYFCSNMKDMFKEMQKLKPTILIAVPALAELFLKLVKQFGINMIGGEVNTIICGGASVPPYLVTEFRKLGINFCPGYGLTELANLVSGNPEGDIKPSSVGLLYPEQEIKLVNDELWIKGKNLMEGYYNEDEENKNAFENGWFKTGDLVRFDEDGYMYIIGRIKDIIVLSNGENVSPAHIESKINEYDFIQDSLVYQDKNSLGIDILVAEVLPRMSVLTKLNIENVQSFIEEKIEELNEKLFNYERISKVIIRKEDFERSPSMKIIRPKRGM